MKNLKVGNKHMSKLFLPRMKSEINLTSGCNIVKDAKENTVSIKFKKQFQLIFAIIATVLHPFTEP